MAQKSKHKKSKGLCGRIYNAVSPLRAHCICSSKKDLTRMIPVELESPVAAQENTKLVQSAGRLENRAKKPRHDFAGREILIVDGQKFAKSASGKKERPIVDKIASTTSNHGSFARKDVDDEDVHEGKFSDYISKVKNRMLKTASSIGGGGRDSFNDKIITNYLY